MHVDEEIAGKQHGLSKIIDEPPRAPNNKKIHCTTNSRTKYKIGNMHVLWCLLCILLDKSAHNKFSVAVLLFGGNT